MRNILLICLILVFLFGCREVPSSMDNVITKKELCEYYNIPESTFDDVDFDLFMYYLDGNWELFHMVSSDHVINALEDFKALPNEDKTYEGITGKWI